MKATVVDVNTFNFQDQVCSTDNELKCTDDILNMNLTTCKTSRPCSGLIMANETVVIDSEWEKTMFKSAFPDSWNHYIQYKQLFNEKTG